MSDVRCHIPDVRCQMSSVLWYYYITVAEMFVLVCSVLFTPNLLIKKLPPEYGSPLTMALHQGQMQWYKNRKQSYKKVWLKIVSCLVVLEIVL